jgi:2-C-methyl-D-erythritol 4-phosphate cytidylyltransferase/2-C-methyl-D-erythritol 2,4-cyclodiphosphate synthase
MTGCAALVLAGGSGSRFGGEIPKQYQILGDRIVLRHAVDALLAHSAIDNVRVVLRPEDRSLYDQAFSDVAILSPTLGGATRQESTRLGLESLKDLAPDYVLIHDGARPFPDGGLINRALGAIRYTPGAIPALPVNDTLKRASADGRTIADTVDRRGLWRAQTPQAFRYQDILRAHDKARGEELTDDAMIAEKAGLPVTLVMGSEDNIKITTPEDMKRVQQLLAGSAGITRIGFGFDVHEFRAGDHVMLCGVRIPHEKGLEGHSDADAGLHALTDALLGAIGDGDIGMHFPPSDPKWRDADSSDFLRHAGTLIAGRNGAIANVDVTLICESPKIGPHRESMRQRIAHILDIDLSRVSVKATTTEGLGFTGRREGIAAQAVASVILPAS